MANAANLVLPGSTTVYALKDAEARAGLAAAKASILALNAEAVRLGLMLTDVEASYQWQSQPSGSTGWSDSSGNNSSGVTDTLNLTAKAWQDGYRFRCLITLADGSTCASPTITLHVGDTTGARQPQANRDGEYILSVSDTELYVSAGETVDVAAAVRRFDDALLGADLSELKTKASRADAKAASVAPLLTAAEGLTYQWQSRPAGESGWNDSSATGFDTSAMTLTAKAWQDDYDFRCQITDADGNTYTSPVITLHVGDETGSGAPVAAVAGGYIVTAVSDIYAAAGESVEFSISVQTVNTSLIASAQPYAFYGNFGDLYETPELEDVSAGAAFDLAESTSAQIYALYDSLMAEHPESITRDLLGYATAGDGTAATGDVTADAAYPIYEYVVKPRASALYNDTTFASKPVILLNGGLHAGTEKAAVWAIWQLVKAMFDSGDKALRAIRGNAVLKIVPIANPWGYDAQTRTNARNVNLNRNFGYNWTAGSSDSTSTEYRGEASYSELETQALAQWLNDNSNAMLCIDFHNCFATNENAWVCSRDERTHRLFAPFSAVMSDSLCARYAIETEKNLFRSSDEKHAGLADECRLVGIGRHCCLEFNVYFKGNKYNARSIQLGVDVLANFILATLGDAARG